jgi:hypothetical protein
MAYKLMSCELSNFEKLKSELEVVSVDKKVLKQVNNECDRSPEINKDYPANSRLLVFG